MITDILPFIILLLHITDKWCLSKGNLLPVYVITIASSITTILYNCLIVSDLNGTHKSILVFCIMSLWTVSMAVKGLLRLRKEKLLKRLPSIPTRPLSMPAKYKDDKNVRY